MTRLDRSANAACDSTARTSQGRALPGTNQRATTAWPIGRRICQTAVMALFVPLAMFCVVPEAAVADDRAALTTLYNSTGGPSWTENSNWLSSSPLSEWFGVEVDSDGRVQYLFLGDNGLTGEIPAALGGLGRLEILDLSGNALSGPIPADLGQLADLNSLLLSENALSGPIPDLGSLVALQNLGLESNGLDGQIPPSLGDLKQLRYLDLSANALAGQIPQKLGDLPALDYLVLHGNRLTGPVPPSLGNLRALRHLQIQDNDLEGVLPVELRNLSRLEYLAVYGNEVCAPREAGFQFWLHNVSFVGVTCPPDERSLIDVAVTYTHTARRSLRGQAGIRAEIDLLFSEANYAYAQSGINLGVVLAGAREVQYVGTNSSVDLDRLEDCGDGYLDEVHEFREETGADIVVLVVGSQDWGVTSATCGRANQLTAPWLDDKFSSRAFAVIAIDCGTTTFVHELGHLMGVAHDRYVECAGNRCGLAAFPYGYGYVNQRAFDRAAPWAARWRTVMAYDEQCEDAGFQCLQLLRFSNPVQTRARDPMGVPGRRESVDLNGPSDAARTLNLTREFVSRIRAGALEGPPVTISFGADEFVAVEGADEAAVTVRLSLPAAREVAVPLTLGLEGGASFDDYSGVPVRVVFAKGETAVTFPLLASDDAVDDNGESVVLGFGPLPRGIAAGNPSKAEVALEDNDLTSQAIMLPSGREILLTRDGDGPWMLDGARADNGVEVAGGGRVHVLELADNRWRLALYGVRTAAGRTTVVDGIGAIRANLFRPADVAADDVGNVYITDSLHHSVRMVDPAGEISTVAGTGDWGFAGDGESALRARLYEPLGLALDGSGNLYVADSGNHRVRRVTSPTGVIETVAGTGQRGFSGGGGRADAASLADPWGVAIGATGTVYVTDQGNNRVRRIDPVAGSIETVAGTGYWGYSGDGGPASEATIQFPSGIALDRLGNIYIADTWGHRLRRIDAWTRQIGTLAGSDSVEYSGDGGVATDATLHAPTGVAVDTSGNVFVSDTWNDRVRKIDATTAIISTVAGTGQWGFSGDGGAATDAQLAEPLGLAIDAAGNLFVADSSNHRVRRIDHETGIISTFAGSGLASSRWNGGNVGEAWLNSPVDLALEPAGEVLFIDSNRVWKLNSAGFIEKVAGTARGEELGDGGMASQATLAGPQGIAADAAGNVYVADTWNHRIRRIDAATGLIETIAGTGEAGDSGDGGSASDARLSRPEAVEVDLIGNVFVADTGNHRVRRIDRSTGTIETIAGTVDGGRSTAGGPASETLLREPSEVAVDGAGNLYLAGVRDGRVLRVDALTGVIETVLAVESPLALAVDASGNVLVGAGRQILSVSPAGATTVIAGTGRPGFSGDGGPAAGAELSVSGIAVSATGAIWFTDPKSRRIRVLEPWDLQH